jgi:hypothetical protein
MVLLMFIVFGTSFLVLSCFLMGRFLFVWDVLFAFYAAHISALLYCVYSICIKDKDYIGLFVFQVARSARYS